MDERQFWIEFRRWLKGRMAADQQMVAAIEKRFGLEERKRDRPPRPAA